MPSRRSILAGLLAAGLAPRVSWADAGSPAFISAARAPEGRYVLCGMDVSGQVVFQVPLPDRGHAAAAHPTAPHAVAFARRPGTFAVVIDCVTGSVLQHLSTPRGRHFYGHGTFVEGGDILITTENDFDAGQGVLGLWDVRNGYARVGEITSGGVGPHDIKLLPDGTLAIANGGIKTHPDAPRVKLNIPTMRPNLAYLSLSGAVLERIELEPALHTNSIRHLATDRFGRVGMALQWQGDPHEPVPLLALHDRAAGALTLTEPGVHAGMMGYAGSIAMSGQHVAITSPRGGKLQVFDIHLLGLSAIHNRADICGLARLETGFATTTGTGRFESFGGPMAQSTSALQWDNHLIAIG